VLQLLAYCVFPLIVHGQHQRFEEKMEEAKGIQIGNVLMYSDRTLFSSPAIKACYDLIDEGNVNLAALHEKLFDEKYCNAVAFILGGIRDSRSIPLLIRTLSNEKSSGWAEMALHNYGKLADDAIKDHIKSDNQNIVRSLIELIGQRKDPDLYDLLPPFIETADVLTRCCSVRIMAQLGDKRFIPSFKKALDDEDKYIVLWAKQGLEKIFADKVAFQKPTEWKAYLDKHGF
jgi:hypothetical protein